MLTCIFAGIALGSVAGAHYFDYTQGGLLLDNKLIIEIIGGSICGLAIELLNHKYKIYTYNS